MEIPHNQVPEQTLLAIIEEFISREGTDYGHREYTLDEKVEIFDKHFKPVVYLKVKPTKWSMYGYDKH